MSAKVSSTVCIWDIIHWDATWLFFLRICARGGGSCVCVPRSAASAAKRLESQFCSSYMIYIVYVRYDIHTCDRVHTWYMIHWVLHTHMMYVYDIHCVYIYTQIWYSSYVIYNTLSTTYKYDVHLWYTLCSSYRIYTNTIEFIYDM